MKKGRNLFNISIIGLFIIAFSFSVITAFYNVTASFIELAVTTICFGVFIVFSVAVKREAFSLFANIRKKLTQTEKQELESFPLPVCIVNSEGEFVWYSNSFLIDVLNGENLLGSFFKETFKDFEEENLSVSFKGKRFAVYKSELNSEKQKYTVYYFAENTKIKIESEQFYLRRPSVVHILIDNFEELVNAANGSEKNFISSRIESTLEKTFVSESKGVLRRLEKDRFVAIIDTEHLKKLIADKFEILDKIHKITFGKVSATLSMGVSMDCDTLQKSDQMARQALDMALGRGGDQVAVKSDSSFEFFGGLSRGVEKSAKVRARMIASALSELISESENVVIMGHKMADFDCLGAAIGLCKATLSLSKPVHICIDRENNLSKELISHLVDGGYDRMLISPEQALEAVNEKTLLIIVDTHNPLFVECSDLLGLTDNIVVIDHHRKMVNYIDNTVIFYHEPTASSTCEMATEILEYFNSSSIISRLEAEALLAGIMLDTKNFIIKSGVRTFEAAAYLRKIGANLVKVNSWFASSIETYHERANLISASEIYKGCAISMQNEFSNELLLAVPQTADELLHIKNVSASFVMYLRDGVVSISARSFGNINVQLIMEKLGGGGHLTMAGAQIKAENCQTVKQMLIEAIDEYLKNNGSI